MIGYLVPAQHRPQLIPRTKCPRKCISEDTTPGGGSFEIRSIIILDTFPEKGSGVCSAQGDASRARNFPRGTHTEFSCPRKCKNVLGNPVCLPKSKMKNVLRNTISFCQFLCCFWPVQKILLELAKRSRNMCLAKSADFGAPGAKSLMFFDL